MKKVYLAGAIWGAADPLTWREEVKKALPKEWRASDPLSLGSASNINCLELVRMDMAEILHCDAVIARTLQPSWGTAMEISFAFSHRIPIIGWVADFNSQQSPWLEAHCTWFVDSPKAAAEQLKAIE